MPENPDDDEPDPPPVASKPGAEVPHTPARPIVFVKFARHGGLPYEVGAESRLDALGIGPWSELAADFPGIRLAPVFSGLSPQELDALIERAERTAPAERGGKPFRAPDLRGSYVVEAPPETPRKDLEGIARRLRKWESVAAAYVSRPGPPPMVNPSQNQGWGRPGQGYLTAAARGIDAEYAWEIPGGDGADQRLIDIEAAWWRNHPDLAAHAIPAQLVGEIDPTWRDHGTAVLGVICARDDANKGLGIVPNLGANLPAGTGVRVASYFRDDGTDATRFGRAHNIANTIAVAAARLAYGEVLLLEAQVKWGPKDVLSPVEVEDVVFDAIRLATAAGVVVVEAGGNGAQQVKDGVTTDLPVDLDGFKNDASKSILLRDEENPDFRDSGAILVTAAYSARTSDPPPNTRLPLMPFGKRIDCYAWGEQLWTTWWDGYGTNYVDGRLTSTSAASAIVAGAALSVQGMVFAKYGLRLGPVQMRSLLGDPNYGTVPHESETTHIGVMPDLRKIADDALAILPIVYLRDHVGDVGLPHLGDISSSPDVILSSQQVADPQAAYGEGSGTENSQTLSSAAVRGQTNYVYVRARNRGGGDAKNVYVDVYWAPYSTLVTPDQWTKVGTTKLAVVPAGDVLTVAPEIAWPAASLPPAGHFCFVAVSRIGQPPLPPPANLLTISAFRAMIRNNNDVTWRNFDVVEMKFSGANALMELRFEVGGAPREDEPMEFEVRSGLPPGSELAVEGPLDFLVAVHGQSPQLQVDRRNDRALLELPWHGSFTLGRAEMSPGLRVALRLLVRIPPARRQFPYEIWVRQKWRGEEVGRVTWRLVPARG